MERKMHRVYSEVGDLAVAQNYNDYFRIIG
jgi:hypothetical protein